ncbi:MAG TPA: hypothetical protein VGX48_18865 [Pyrinomonadaceae bacterium]|jgi:hypothetical protein|nr:hypothetical protein [Pyrinomonadaceae bacterium]
MKGILNRIVFAALALLCAATSARADIKIKSKTSFGDQAGVEQTVYIKGKRQRTESTGGMATVTQCDLRRTVQLNDLSRTYMLNPFGGGAGAATVEAADTETRTSTVRKGGVVTMTYTTADTGERRQMFGYTARRIKTAVVTEPSPDACSQDKTRMETDGWYIDLNVGFDCYESAGASAAPRAAGGCRDKFRTRQVGSAKLGYPVKVTTTIFGEDGKPSSSFTQEVIELSQATLEQSLFEIPEGYREVRDARQMYSASAVAAAMSSDGDDDEDEDSAKSGRRAAATGGTNAAARASSAGTGSGVGVTSAGGASNDAGTAGSGAPQRKRPGVVRVGLAPAKTGAVGEGMDAAKLAEAVRNTLASYLSGPTVEVVRLEARLPQQAEARQKGCDLVLYATASHKKGGGGGFGGFLKRAAPIADSVIPYGNDAAEHVASQVASETIYTAADAASSVKSKDELTLEFGVQTLAAGSAPLTKTVKAKAKSDGDDLLSRLVEQAAAEVLAAASKAGGER